MKVKNSNQYLYYYCILILLSGPARGEDYVLPPGGLLPGV
jgi:hypothetical protein